MRGFTQIEIAVIILVIGILASIAAPSFLQWQQQRKVDQAVIILEDAIRETQAEAVKRSQSCELIVREGFNSQANGAVALVSGDCITSTSDLEFVGVDLKYKPSSTLNPPPTEWHIIFNARGENRDVQKGPGTAIFSVPNTNVQQKCLVMSTGIGLRRNGKWDDPNNLCVTS